MVYELSMVLLLPVAQLFPPLISVLFMASFILPLFMPQGTKMDHGDLKIEKHERCIKKCIGSI